MALAREESSPLFAGTVAGTLKLITYMALALVLMVLDHRNGWIHRVRYTASAVVEPVYRLASLPASGVRAVTVAFADRSRLTEQNQHLREDLLLANAKLNRMAAVAEQNQRLKELLDTQHSLDLNVQLARVLDVDIGSYNSRMVINLGAKDGVKQGQVVIDAHGVIGQVTQVLPRTATVMLLTDPEHAIPVEIERTGLRTMAFGAGDGGQLTLPTIPLAADVHTGDRLLTSGLGGHFPPGFPVGEVSSVGQAASGMFQEARAKPVAQLGRSDEVLLLHELAEPIGPPAPAVPAGPPATLAAPAPVPASASSAGAAARVPVKPAAPAVPSPNPAGEIQP